MIEQNESKSRKYDTPIPKPPDEAFERFIRSTEARLVTKRFTNERRRPLPARIERLEAR